MAQTGARFEMPPSIKIGDEIEISITKIEGDSVKIGISAPRSISIFRREILEEMQTSNLAAVVSPGPMQASILKSTLAAGSAKKLIEKFKAKKIPSKIEKSED